MLPPVPALRGKTSARIPVVVGTGLERDVRTRASSSHQRLATGETGGAIWWPSARLRAHVLRALLPYPRRGESPDCRSNRGRQSRDSEQLPGYLRWSRRRCRRSESQGSRRTQRKHFIVTLEARAAALRYLSNLSLHLREAAVHKQLDSADEAAVICRQEHRGLRNLVADPD